MDSRDHAVFGRFAPSGYTRPGDNREGHFR